MKRTVISIGMALLAAAMLPTVWGSDIGGDAQDIKTDIAAIKADFVIVKGDVAKVREDRKAVAGAFGAWLSARITFGAGSPQAKAALAALSQAQKALYAEQRVTRKDVGALDRQMQDRIADQLDLDKDVRNALRADIRADARQVAELNKAVGLDRAAVARDLAAYIKDPTAANLATLQTAQTTLDKTLAARAEAATDLKADEQHLAREYAYIHMDKDAALREKDVVRDQKELGRLNQDIFKDGLRLEAERAKLTQEVRAFSKLVEEGKINSPKAKALLADMRRTQAQINKGMAERRGDIREAHVVGRDLRTDNRTISRDLRRPSGGGRH